MNGMLEYEVFLAAYGLFHSTVAISSGYPEPTVYTAYPQGYVNETSMRFKIIKTKIAIHDIQKEAKRINGLPASFHYLI